MADASSQSNHMADTEGFLDVDGDGFYVIPRADLLTPFLMSIVSDADHWMFVSSGGALTAGRRDPALALFPYETDDRLHLASGATGPITMFRPAGSPTVWQPFSGLPSPGVRHNLYKSVVGNQVVFEEIDPRLGFAFRYRWSNSDRFGFVRTATLVNLGDRAASVACAGRAAEPPAVRARAVAVSKHEQPHQRR